MNSSDYVLYTLLGIIIMLMVIAIIVFMRKRPQAQAHIAHSTPFPSDAVEELPREPEQETPQTDPLQKYLTYLKSVCDSVEQINDEEYILLSKAWSLPGTLEIAKATDYYLMEEDQEPTMRLYFYFDNRNHWQITDHGDNAAVVHQVSRQPQQELDSFKKEMKSNKLTFDHNSVLQGNGDSYKDFEPTFKALCDTVKAMDDHWTEVVWESAGPLLYTFNNPEGNLQEFSGEDRSNTYNLQKTRSFTLRQGALAILFENTDDTNRATDEGLIHLVRDNPGTFDTEFPFGSFEPNQPTMTILRVAEGMWRDPHPGISYHLEVKCRGKWTCKLFQPDPGKSKGTFPHRGGLHYGSAVMGPFRTTAKPTNLFMDHAGMGYFSLDFVSIDGTHQPETIWAEGQFHTEDTQLDLLPGKEYLAFASGDGKWQIKLTEGY